MRITSPVWIAIFLSIAAGCGKSPQGYLERGDKLFAAGNFADAKINYKNAIQKKPDFAQAYYKLGITEGKLGDANEAYRAFSQAVELAPSNLDAKVKLADLVLPEYARDPQRLQKLHETIASTARQLLAKDPKSFDGFRLQGALALLDGKVPEAIDSLTKANEAKPMQSEVVNNLALALTRNHQTADAEKLARDLLAKDPNFEPATRILYAILVSGGRQQEAESLLRSRADRNPKDVRSLITLARHYAAAKQRTEMEAVLQKLTSNPKDFPDGRLEAGDFYNSIGDRQSARAQYEEGQRTAGAKKLVYQKRIVAVLIETGKRDEALALTASILKDNPKDAEIIQTNAALRLERRGNGDVDAAIAAFQSLVASQPGKAPLLYKLGEAYEVKGDAKEARKQFQDSARSNPGYIPPRFALAQLDLRERQYEEALRYLNEVLAAEPKNRQAKFLHAAALTALERYADARAELNAMLAAAPNDAEAQLQLAALSLTEKQYKIAEAAFERLYKPGQNDPRPVIGLANVYLSQGDSARAIAVLQRELKTKDNPVIRLALADDAANAHNFTLALAEYQTLVAKNPTDALLLFRMGSVYRAAGRNDEAIASMQKAQELAPKSPDVAAALAALFVGAGRSQDSVNQFRRVLSVDPENSFAMNGLAFLAAEGGGNLDEALKFAKTATQKQPDNPHFHDTLGYVYLKRHQTADAEQIFRNLVDKDPANPTYRFHLASAYFEKGDKPAAKEELQRALQQKPERSQEQKIRQMLAAIG
jgi:tetratricopeptide (TPR) repeat protein